MKEAVVILEILSWTFAFTLLNLTFESILLARRKEAFLNTGLLSSAAIAALSGIFLIGEYGASGAAFSAVLGEIFMSVFYFFIIIFKKRKISNYNKS
jgi:O-antigen/teichoic acid export membrane protein